MAEKNTQKKVELTPEEIQELVKKNEALEAENKAHQQLIEEQAKALATAEKATQALKKSFTKGDKTYEIVIPKFILNKVTYTEEQLLEDENLQDTLIKMKSGVISLVGGETEEN